MSDLMILSGKLQGRTLNLPDYEITVGRDEGCHIRLSSSLVSRQHCKISKSPEGIWIEDLASQNGTFVNDEPIGERHLLKPGDTFRVGASQFQVSPIKPPVSKSKVSDDLISDWLSDSGSSSQSGDTTIIRGAPKSAAGTATPRAVETRTPPDSHNSLGNLTDPVAIRSRETSSVKPESSHSIPTMNPPPAQTPSTNSHKSPPARQRSIQEEAAEIIKRFREQKYSRGRPPS